MDEVFGSENFVSLVTFKKTSSASSELLAGVADYLLWYAKDLGNLKYRQIYFRKEIGGVGGDQYNWIEKPDGDFENTGMKMTRSKPDEYFASTI